MSMSTELLNYQKIIAEEKKTFLCKPTFTAEDHVLLVVADGVKVHPLQFTVLTQCQDNFLGFILLTAGLTAEHRYSTLQAKIIISTTTIMVS